MTSTARYHYEPTTPTDWRIEEMNRAGIHPSVSHLLAISPGADLHKMIEAHNAGCSDDLLLTIFQEPPAKRSKALCAEMNDPVRDEKRPLSSEETGE
jgi:hypothetical protein